MQTNRRTLMLGAAAFAAAASLPADASGFITITNDGRFITSPMPPDETVVEVKLSDGSACRAWYSCNIMEAGDWDFLPMPADQDEPDIEVDSIADQVVAWRRLTSEDGK